MPQDSSRKERKGKHDPCDEQQRVYQRLTAHGFLFQAQRGRSYPASVRESTNPFLTR